MGDNYSSLVQRISDSSELNVEEIERRIEAKRAKLSGLVSKEGAAQIVAAELGINFDEERMKISQIVHGMRKANVLGKILEIYPVREYNKNGREGKVCNFLIADDSANTRAVLWDSNLISLIEKGKLKAGDFVEISNASVRNGEIHLGSFADLKKSKEKVDNVIEKKSYAEKLLSEAKPGERFKTRAVVVGVFEPRYFEVCPECGKKAVSGNCTGSHGSIEAKKRALLNLMLDDGSEVVRCVLFGEMIQKLGFNNEEVFDLNAFSSVKTNVLGEEKYFSGNLRKNEIYNNVEMTIEAVEDVNVQELISELEMKS